MTTEKINYRMLKVTNERRGKGKKRQRFERQFIAQQQTQFKQLFTFNTFFRLSIRVFKMLYRVEFQKSTRTATLILIQQPVTITISNQRPAIKIIVVKNLKGARRRSFSVSFP